MYKITTLILLLVTLCGCIKESLDDCVQYLRFKYDYNLEYKDLFAEQVEQVQVYLFDSNNKYVCTISDSGEVLKSPNYKINLTQRLATTPALQQHIATAGWLNLRGFKCVVWAGKTEQFYQLPVMQEGDPVEKLTLAYTPAGMESDKKIDNLWHNGPTTLSFEQEAATTQTLSLVRDTNDINLKLINKAGEDVAVGQYKVNIKGKNGSYDYKNSYLTNNQYINYKRFEQSEGVVSHLRTLRLMDGDDITLTVTNESGKQLEVEGKTEIDLVKYLKMSAPSGMQAQEYLDRKYIWDITFTVDTGEFLAINIIVNDWVLWFQNSEM